ncbi:MAG: hypothetical protein JWR21_2500 [Herminiimonas sp.]|nr:hypothetical protein [Herminiimonas sp.]MDB5852278.1 hypothetical protein [Herminiimonas sp.]
MVDVPRKKSPRFPSMSLDEALDRAIKVYEKERLHAAAVDIVATHIGYKSANNGSALAALASLRYYGLLERPKEGFLAVSKDVESFRYAPEEEHRQALLIKFLKQPPLYAELLEKYATGLPSDANLRYELIQRGFNPSAAAYALGVFKRSVDFAGFYDVAPTPVEAEAVEGNEQSTFSRVDDASAAPALFAAGRTTPVALPQSVEHEDFDRIPVRLPGGRRSWLVIPTPFYSADKVRLKAQIDLLLAEDEDDAS